MNIENLWPVIETYSTAYKYLWNFPVFFDITHQRIACYSKNSVAFQIWNVNLCIILYGVLFSSISCLLWANFSIANPLAVISIIACILTTILGIFGVIAYTGVCYVVKEEGESAGISNQYFQINREDVTSK